MPQYDCSDLVVEGRSDSSWSPCLFRVWTLDPPVLTIRVIVVLENHLNSSCWLIGFIDYIGCNKELRSLAPPLLHTSLRGEEDGVDILAFVISQNSFSVSYYPLAVGKHAMTIVVCFCWLVSAITHIYRTYRTNKQYGQSICPYIVQCNSLQPSIHGYLHNHPHNKTFQEPNPRWMVQPGGIDCIPSPQCLRIQDL
jgi:hypothetical protein